MESRDKDAENTPHEGVPEDMKVVGPESEGLRVAFRAETVVPWEEIGDMANDRWTDEHVNSPSTTTKPFRRIAAPIPWLAFLGGISLLVGALLYSRGWQVPGFLLGMCGALGVIAAFEVMAS